MGASTADAVVLGGGLIGSTIALRLAQRNLRVIVLDRSDPGSEASRAAAGILSPQAEAESPSPFYRLSEASRDRYPDFARELQELTGIDVELCLDGVVFVATSEAEQEALDRRVAWQSRAGLSVERLTPNQARELEPVLGPDLTGAVLFPKDGHVENARLTVAVIRAAERAGADFRAWEPALSILHDKGKVHGVETAGGALQAPVVVNAAGAWAHLDRRLPFPIPVGPARGEMLSVRARELPQRVVYSEGVYLVPRLDGRLLLGATMERGGYDKSIKLRGLVTLWEKAVALVPSVTNARFDSAWAGLRPCTPDQWPLLGLTAFDGLFLATGHCRNGILLAPLTADILAELITSGRTEWNLGAFSVSRFSVV